VPNQEEVIAELARVLKTGGIAGFSEPGRLHSQSPQSQYEMKNYKVLENDIVLTEIFDIAKNYGFDDLKCKLISDKELSLSEYQSLTGSIEAKKMFELVGDNIHNLMNNKTVFFLFKGEFVLDSRSHMGMAHSISIDKKEFNVKAGNDLDLPLRVSNSGVARWLNENINDIGAVKIGTHLYDENEELLDSNFSRHLFTNPIEAGETVEKTITVNFNNTGVYNLSIDLVSEQICWFENTGSKPQIVKINVQE